MFISQTKVSFETPSSIIYERKFDTAIRSSTVTNFINRQIQNTTSFDDSLILESRHFSAPENWSIKSDCYARILNKILNNAPYIYDRRSVSEEVARNLDMIGENIMFQSQYMHSNNQLPNKPEVMRGLKKLLTNTDMDDTLLALYNYSKIFQSVVDDSYRINIYKEKYRKLSNDEKLANILKINHKYIKEMDMTLIWSYHLVYINLSGEIYILPKPYILMIHNKISDLLSVYILTLYTKSSSNPSNAVEVLIDFVKELCYLNIKYGEEFFTIAKTLEALCIAETIHEIEIWNNKDFLKTLYNDLYDTIDFDYYGSELRSILKRTDIPFRHELCCLSKIIGHPLVDMKKGAHSLHQKTTERYELNMERIQQTTCFIKENYIRNHIVKYSKWPPHQFNFPSVPLALLTASLRNKDPNSPEIVEKYGPTQITDYIFVDLLPNMKFNKLESIIPYLKDKTITLTRSKVWNSLHDKTPIQSSWRETRLLLFYLLHPSALLNHTEYIDKYSNSDDLEELLDYLVIRVVPKEKELKVLFRGFGCKTYEDRLRALAQEKAVMEYLEIHSDEQAMTLSELDILRRLYAFRKLKAAYTKHRIIYINIDASSWNNRFSSEVVDDVMKVTLDPIFNTAIFSKTHLAFKKSLIYVPDAETTYYWKGQRGGIEGLNQDTWVVIYIAQIKCALANLPHVKYHVLCKGDDFRVAIIVPEHLYDDARIIEIKNVVVKNISSVCKELGHKIKIEDSYGSEEYFTFSKSASIRTIELPQTFRKIQKCYGANNAFLPSFDEYIASTFSNGHSAAKCSPVVYGCYAVSLFWTYYYLLTDKHYSKLSDDELIALTLVPSILGGFPIIYLHNFYVRAESDLLSPFIGMYQFSLRFRSNFSEIFENFLSIKSEQVTTYIQLYKDPYSLPISRPTLPTAVLRNSIIPVLHKMVKNDDVLELFDAIDSPASELAIKCLDSANVLSVKILSNIYAALPVGILEELLRKFESARSIMEILILRGGFKYTSKILLKVVRAERTLQKWRITRLQEGSPNDKSLLRCIRDCPSESSQIIRDTAWGKPVEGIIMPPLQHQIIYTTRLRSALDGWCQNNHFIYHVLPADQKRDSITKDNRIQYSSYNTKPFLGYSTKSGMNLPTVHFIEHNVLLSKIRTMIDLASWTDTHETDEEGNIIASNIRALIEQITRLYTDKPLSVLSPFSGTKNRGTIQHHVRAPSYKESIVPNVLSNHYQSMIGESNSHNRYRMSRANYQINFLHVYCFTNSILFAEAESNRDITTPHEIWAVTTQCDFCNIPISETPIIINTRLLPLIKFNPLQATVINKDAMTIFIESLKTFERTPIYMDGHIQDVTLHTAVTAALQDICENTFEKTQKIQARYTQHNLTQQGMQIMNMIAPKLAPTMITKNDLLHIPVITLANLIAPLIVYYIFCTFTPINSKFLYVQFTNTPHVSLPWLGIATLLYDSGKLNDIIIYYSSVCNLTLSNIHKQPSLLASYLGYLAYEYFRLRVLEFPIVIVSNYDTRVHNLFFDIPIFIQTINIIYDNHRRFLIDNDPEMYVYSLILAASEVWLPANIKIDIENDMRNKDIVLNDVVNYNDDDISYDALLDFELHELPQRSSIFNLVLQLFGIKDNEYHYNMVHENYDAGIGLFNTYLNLTPIIFNQTSLQNACLYLKSLPPIERLHLEVLPHVYPDTWNQPLIEVNTQSIYINNSRFTQVPSTDLVIRRVLPDINPTFGHQSITPNLQFLHRPYGLSNCSTSHWYHLRNKFNIKHYEGLHISVLGDGIGNITNSLCFQFKQSSVLFTTLPFQRYHETRPEIAVNNQEEHRCNLIYDHIQNGMYDLTDPFVLLHYKALMTYNHIIFCDAEAPSEGVINYEIMILNVIQYYLTTRSHNGVLFIRMYLNFPHICLTALTILSQSCTNIYLYTPPGIRCYAQCYIIAFGNKDHHIELPLHTFKTYPVEISQQYEHHLAWAQDKQRTINGQLSEEINYRLRVPARRVNLQEFTPLWISLLSEKTGILLPINYFEELIMTKHNNVVFRSASDLCNTIDIDFNVYIFPYIEALVNNNHRYLPESTIDLNTRAHRILLICRWARIIGFRDMISIIANNKNSNIATRQQYLMSFRTFCQSLPGRDYNNTVNYNLFDHKATDPRDGCEVPYWRNYVTGMNIALSMIGNAYYTRTIILIGG